MRIIIAILLSSILWVSCKTDRNPVAVSEEVLHIAIAKDPNKLHPLIYPVQHARELYQYIFTPIADFHPETLELVPILIQRIPEGKEITAGADQGRTAYVIELREGMTWADGKPVTAADYLFTLKAIMHPETAAGSYRSYLTNIVDARLDPNDPLKITVLFDEYYMLSKEIVSTLELYPKHIYDPQSTLDKIPYEALREADSFSKLAAQDTSLTAFATAFNSVEFSRNTVSSIGPYELKDWVTDQIVVLERKENYWGANETNPMLKAGPKQLIFHIIPDELSIINQLKSGTIDLYPGATAEAFKSLQENEDYGDQFEYFTPELMKFYCINLNNTRPELADKDVRKALAHLVDVEEIITLMENGLANRTNSIFNVKKDYYNHSLQLIQKDIAKAKEILTSEGWTDTDSDGTIDKVIDGKQVELELDMHTTGSDLSNKIALLLSENAKLVGISINIIQKQYSLFKRENLATLDYDLFTGIVGQDLTLDDPYSKWHMENSEPGGTNQTGYKSESASKIIDEIRDTRDASRRTVLYKELQQIMYEDQPVIFLYSPVEKIILSKKWNGSATVKRPGYMANTFTTAN